MSKNQITNRHRRHARIRARIQGTRTKPRLHVFKSNQHIYGGIVDDIQGKTLFSFSDSKLADDKKASKVTLAERVGQELGRVALEAGVHRVVFDRSGYRYHGRVKALAEGAREAGLKF